MTARNWKWMMHSNSLPFSAVGKHGDESVEVTLHKVKTLSHALREGFPIGQIFMYLYHHLCFRYIVLPRFASANC